jgi:hypothetical protein
MANAARGGHESIMRLCHDEWGAADVNTDMARAARRGHEAIVRLCHDEWGASNVDEVIAIADCYNHEAIVRRSTTCGLKKKDLDTLFSVL